MTTPRPPRRSVVALLLATAALLPACLEAEHPVAGFAPPPDPTRRERVANAPKRHRVWVPIFATSWGGDPTLAGEGTTLAQKATRVVAQRLAQNPSIVLDDPQADEPSEVEVRGRLEGTTRGTTAVELRLVARGGTELASVRRATAADASSIETELVRASDELAKVIAELPWSTAVLESSRRLLVTAAGGESGLVVNELLLVRKRPEWRVDSAGRIEHLPGEEVARVYVDALLDHDGQPAGAYCRLWGGSFDGYDLRELVVEEP